MTVQLAGADAFHRWCTVADEVRSTTKRLQKLAALVDYFPSLPDDALAIAARFFSAIVFPRHDARTTQVGGSILWAALASLTGLSDESLAEAYGRHGDAGDMVGDVLVDRPASAHSLGWIEERFAALARATGSTARREIVRGALASLGGNEVRYFAKLLAGELRIGLKEAQVEEAVARTFERPLEQVRHANRLRGDIGEVAILARQGRLELVRLALFHPIGFMLAQPLATPEAIVEALPSPFVLEDKYDGIRAQAHVDGEEVRLFSRTLDDITRGYPEVVASLRGLGAGLVLDGELIAVDPVDRRRARPFAVLQRRLGRKAPTPAVLAEAPVGFVVYDLLAIDHELVLDSSYEARRAHLSSLSWRDDSALMASNTLAVTAHDVETAFARARDAGNEGLIAKDPASAYTPGRRGKSWVKLKRALATLDVVVTGVERGHGRRNHVLSDYTFAVRASEVDPTLLNVGKAYNGLTDAEIATLTKRFESITTERFGRFHTVRPEVVLEVTFDIVQRSTRHKAGYALRFPRIVRVRDDKLPTEIDTLARVRELAGDSDPSTDDA
ncbi:MAG: ATP-dependent DNA ligase [Gemmatimonadetes bacterium]|nr:MAG: ATP-dependent DNA ligase [Gemmatimonadota bacterium]